MAGDVQGLHVEGVVRFSGVPYAESPVGVRRFAPPVPRWPWTGVLDATRFGPRPPQPAMATVFDTGADPGPMDEDCLRVNIYTPGTRDRRPVMVWFHGGGLAFGSANEYDGSNLARNHDVVVVTVGFRLGLLGFADLSPCGRGFEGSASNGFRDQILALQWVRANITAFGGDPGNVTVFGQSGGGLSILALLGAPSADGLFHRAIVLSAGPPQPEPPEVVSILGGTLDAEPTDLPRRLRELPVERIIELQQGIGFTAGGSVDGTVVTRFPVDAIHHHGAAGVPIVIGTTRDEGTLLTSMMAELRPAVLRIIAEGLAAGTFEGADPGPYLSRLDAEIDGDVEFHTRVWTDHFRRTATRVAEAACAAGPGGWLYRFDLEPTGVLADELGVTHAADLGFVFDTLRPAAGPDLYDTTLPSVRATAGRWSATLASFARHGHPNDLQPGWPRHLPDRTCLVVDQTDRIEHDIDRDLQHTWGDR
ncbi:MAG: carboxylesterase family protein [Ilumatobacteraceae bacterium]